MSDISTFDKFKNWLLVGAVGLVITLLSIIATDNRQRIDAMETRIERIIETRLENQSQRIESQAQRLSKIEAMHESQMAEIFRWLSRIDSKLGGSGERRGR